MGYDVHITRRDNWVDENDPRVISLEEWKDLVANDPEMRLDNFAEATTAKGESIYVESDGLSVWTKYSGDGLDGGHAWFDYDNGEIVVKNPDDEILVKMIEIAGKLNAKVQGDEGEIYELSGGNVVISRHVSNSSKKVNDNKPWWKFW